MIWSNCGAMQKKLSTRIFKTPEQNTFLDYNLPASYQPGMEYVGRA
jgi:hypothetical protein